MPAVDFITAFGLLLRDGALRDALAANPRALAEQLNLRESDVAALVQLIPSDLEFQAGVLIRKRLDLVRRFIPQTCRSLGTEAWPAFHAYARNRWPAAEHSAAQDAHDFCGHLQQRLSETVSKAELNRLRFALSQDRFAFHCIRHDNTKPALQFFIRLNRKRWRETTLHVRL